MIASWVTVFLSCMIVERVILKYEVMQWAAPHLTWHFSGTDVWDVSQLDILSAAIIAIAFTFGYAISAFKGPSQIVAGMAHIALLTAILLTAIFFVDYMQVILDENKPRFVSSSEKNLRIIAWMGGLLAASICTWLMVRTPRHYLQHLRMARGQCRACSYDLCGSVGHANCPECGKPIA